MRITLLALLALAACKGKSDDHSDRPPWHPRDTDADDTDVPDTDVVDTDGEDTDAPAPIIVQVPCESAGELGIAVKVMLPDEPRYADGAPVVLHVPGQTDAGSREFVDATAERSRGTIDLAFLLPGGIAGEEARSGGNFDERGPRSTEAVTCVAEFAAGAISTTDGVSLKDLAGMKTAEVGMVAYSNAAPLVLWSLLGSAERTSAVRWVAFNEARAGDHYVVPLLGTSGRPNPTYETGSCTKEACTTAVDIVKITPRTFKWPAAQHPTGVDVPMAYYDLDRDGKFDDAGLGETATFDDLYGESADLLVAPYVADYPDANPQSFYPLELLTELEERLGADVLAAAGIASSADAVGFWQWRDPFRGDTVAQLSEARPDLAVMILATAEDHAQAAPDHPHIVIQYRLWTNTSWIRLNPDAAYLDGSPDLDANADLGGAAIAEGLLDETISGRAIQTAAVGELADRTHAGDWSANLADKLY